MFLIKSITAGTIFAALLFSACQSPQATENKNTTSAAPANTAAAKAADPKDVEAVKEMLAKHDKALNDHNIDAVMDTFSKDPKVVLLGTGQGERFVGTEAIKNAYTEIFKDYEKGTLVTDCEWKTGDVEPAGKLAWMAATCKAVDSMKGAKREFVLNASAATVKEDTGWRFIMLHMSNATSGGPPPADKK
jgi:uncharacterized protein (TIGR02246 family)